MWNELKLLALNIVRDDSRYTDETEEQLLRWVLNTGYPGARKSHESTRDLLYVYAASLLNSGAPGPAFDRFAEMITMALTRLINDNVIGEVELTVLARNCGDYLDKSDAGPITKNGTVDYRRQLERMARGQNETGILFQLLTSVIEFIEFLRRNYGGSAATYHRAFANTYDGACPNFFVLAKYAEISNFKRIGVAVGMNFFKDSQVRGFQIPNQTLSDTYTSNVGWFVKPDKHVLRLMLCATGRMFRGGINHEDLFNLNDQITLKAYTGFDEKNYPNQHYNLCRGRNKNEMGKWYCIEDIHRIAAREGISPLAYDRLLYLIGSGRYKDPGKRLSLSQEERYRLFINVFLDDADTGIQITPKIPVLQPLPPISRAPKTAHKMIFERSASDLFYDSIAGSDQARRLIDAVTSICNTENVTLHNTYTNGGDVRIRANRSRGKSTEQNVVTISWKPNLARFSCLTILSMEECIDLGMPKENLNTNHHGPLPTRVNVSPGVDDRLFIAIVRRSIDQFRAL
jgi:hypothetical protein